MAVECRKGTESERFHSQIELGALANSVTVHVRYRVSCHTYHSTIDCRRGVDKQRIP